MCHTKIYIPYLNTHITYQTLIVLLCSTLFETCIKLEKSFWHTIKPFSIEITALYICLTLYNLF